MYLVVHRRRFLWGVLIALCCLLLPFLGGAAARAAAAAYQGENLSKPVAANPGKTVFARENRPNGENSTEFSEISKQFFF